MLNPNYPGCCAKIMHTFEIIFWDNFSRLNMCSVECCILWRAVGWLSFNINFCKEGIPPDTGAGVIRVNPIHEFPFMSQSVPRSIHSTFCTGNAEMTKVGHRVLLVHSAIRHSPVRSRVERFLERKNGTHVILCQIVIGPQFQNLTFKLGCLTWRRASY